MLVRGDPRVRRHPKQEGASREQLNQVIDLMPELLLHPAASSSRRFSA
jgi:hypothetical protein